MPITAPHSLSTGQPLEPLAKSAVIVMNASSPVSVRQSAKVNGNIFAPRVGLADGAHFSGRIDMNHKGVAAKVDKDGSLTETAAERLLAAG